MGDLAAALGFAVIVLGCLVVGAVLAVIRLHATALRRAPSGSGIVSWHVVTISLAHLSFVVGTALGVLDVLGILETPLEVRLGLYAGGSVLTLAALIIIGSGQRLRVRGPNAHAHSPTTGRHPTSHRRRR